MFPDKKQSIFIVFALILIQLMLSVFFVRLGVVWNSGNPLMYILLVTISTSFIVWHSNQINQLKILQIFHAGFTSVRRLMIVVILPIIFVSFSIQILAGNIISVQSFYFGQTEISQDIQSLAGSAVLGFISICVVAPLAEELIFRGVILRGLLSNYPENVALTVSSVLFSLYHINPDQLIFTLIAGYFLGWLYIKSYSLWPSIFAHSSLNAFSYVFGSWPEEVGGVNYFPQGEIVLPPLWLQVFSIIVLVFSMRYLNKILKNST